MHYNYFMSTKSATVHARMTPDLKQEAEGILKQLGLTATDAVSLLYKQIIWSRGLPFDVKIPNQETLEAIESVKKKQDITSVNNLDELRKNLLD